MPQITRKLEFDSGHRVLNHEGKCANLHGHRYVAEITVSALGLDDIGRVVDFSLIKSLVGKWIDDNWDHNILLNESDPLYQCYMNPVLLRHGDGGIQAGDVFFNKEPFLIPNGKNPTAEVMAEILFNIACELLIIHGITVERVRLYETPNCWADFSR